MYHILRIRCIKSIPVICLIVANEIGLKINAIRYTEFNTFSWTILMADLNRYKLCLYVNELDVSCVECYLWLTHWHGVLIATRVHHYVIWTRDVTAADVVTCMRALLQTQTVNVHHVWYLQFIYTSPIFFVQQKNQKKKTRTSHLPLFVINICFFKPIF